MISEARACFREQKCSRPLHFSIKWTIPSSASFMEMKWWFLVYEYKNSLHSIIQSAVLIIITNNCREIFAMISTSFIMMKLFCISLTHIWCVYVWCVYVWIPLVMSSFSTWKLWLEECLCSSFHWSASWAEILDASKVISPAMHPKWGPQETLNFICKSCTWAQELSCI